MVSSPCSGHCARAGRPAPMADWASRSGFFKRPLLHVTQAVVAYVLLAVLAIGTQLWVGAYHAEFEGDAAGHYASGVVIHDYIVSAFQGLSRSPMAFVAWFHSHYPIVGIGHWPPAYYLAEALWMLCFSDSRSSLLILVAATTAATAFLIWFSVHRRFGPASAYIAAGTFVIIPPVPAKYRRLDAGYSRGIGQLRGHHRLRPLRRNRQVTLEHPFCGYWRQFRS